MSLKNMSNHAIVFVHGLLGFSTFSILGKKIYYFRRLHTDLEVACPTFFPRLPPAARIETRARVLADFLSQVHAEQIDLIAHSMGGLDCRYLIYALDPTHRVRSLTTIMTPHHGSPLAQWVIDGTVPFSWFLYKLSAPAVRDLTPAACARFNRVVPNRPDVCYYAYASARPSKHMSPILRHWGKKMAASDGENDGMVPVTSAQWGEFLGVLQADHFELTGWSLAMPNAQRARPFDHLRFYRDLVKELTANG